MLGCGYRPPSEALTYWEKLEHNLARVTETAAESTTLVGDFNVDIHTASFTPLHDICANIDLVNYVHSPTRITSHSRKVIDLFFTSAELDGTCEVLPLDISDHFGLLARLVIPIPKSTKRRVTSRSLYKVDWSVFNTELADSLASFRITCNINEAVESWYRILRAVLDRHAPMLPKNRTRRPCPWLTDNLVQLVRRRNALHKQVSCKRSNK
eukprot:scpid60791/ scgid13985/ 